MAKTVTDNFMEFEADLKKAASTMFPAQANRFKRAVALTLLRGVVVREPYPVDTGRYRGNWQVTVDQPAPGEIDRIDKEGGSTLAAGSRVIDGVKRGEDIWVTNNVPYAWVLETGGDNPKRKVWAILGQALAAMKFIRHIR